MTSINPTPKSRFQANTKNIEAHRALMQRADFELSCDYALLEYQRILSQLDSSLNNAAASHFRMMGAQEFLATLRNLAEMPVAPKVVSPTSLNHQV